MIELWYATIKEMIFLKQNIFASKHAF